MHNLPAHDMKFGVLIARDCAEYVDANMQLLLDELANLGCTTERIVLREVPTTHDLLLGTEFFAEYTDVDGVIILAPNNRIIGNLALMNGIVTIQIQWNMAVAIGGAECAANIVEMICIQNEMESEAVMVKPRRNIN